MKIKCPICGDLYKDFEEIELVKHLGKSHSDLFIRQKYVKQLFKIHEKIAEVEKDKDYYANVKKYETFSEDYALPILKSLLEDEK